MKQAVFGMVSTLMMVFIFLLLMTAHGRNLRKEEADNTLADAVDVAMSNLMEQKVYSITSKDEFVADLLQSLLVQLNSTSDVKVCILEADEKKGILSVEVTETYTHPNGRKGTVSAVRTVIMDRKAPKENAVHTVEFYVTDEQLYKRYTLPDKGVCKLPKNPQKEGKTFRNWRFVTGGKAVADHAFSVEEDAKLIAVFD